jgi:flagellar biogenesis protein FliO
MRSYLEKYRLLYGHIGAIIALIIAVIYLVVIPGEVLFKITSHAPIIY